MKILSADSAYDSTQLRDFSLLNGIKLNAKSNPRNQKKTQKTILL